MAEEVVDVRGGGADQSVEPLAASCSHFRFYNESKFTRINL